MKGLQLSEKFYFEIVKPLIEINFPNLINRFAGGLIGYGSDILEYDDELSRDHEWGPRCHIWLLDEDYIKYAQDIQNVLQEQIPLEYNGFYTMFRYSDTYMALVTSDKREESFPHIAITTVKRHMHIQFGIEKHDNEYMLTDTEWLCIPEQKLIELTKGKVFDDKIGDITQVREKFKYYPEHIRRYKMAYCWEQIDDMNLISLDYKRGNLIGANVILNRIIENIVRLTYLYNSQYYAGYLKWFGYKFSELSVIASEIEQIILETYKEIEIDVIIKNLSTIIDIILKEHNRQSITTELATRKNLVGRGLSQISVRHFSDEIKKTLPDNMRSLGISGSCDQWITNGDELIWAEKYMQFKKLYENNYFNERSGVGDLII